MTSTAVAPTAEAHGPAAEREVDVLIASGHALLRAGYRALLEDAAGIQMTGEAATGDEAMMKLRARDRAQLVAFAYESGLVVSHRGQLRPVQ
jgi:DNA-binding NarL/FixJ family response regulator